MRKFFWALEDLNRELDLFGRESCSGPSRLQSFVAFTLLGLVGLQETSSVPWLLLLHEEATELLSLHDDLCM